MRIGDCIPPSARSFLAFRAYGLPAPERPSPAPIPGGTPDLTSPQRVAQLVGARIAAPATLGAALDAATPRTAPNAIAYPMYTRSADRVEAAVAVQLGRTVDVRG